MSVPALPWPAELSSTPGWTPAASRELLGGLLSSTWSAVRALSASALDVPQLEFKLAAGQHLHVLVALAGDLEDRLGELSAAAVRGPGPTDRSRLGRTLATDPATARVAAVYGYWLPRVVAEVVEAQARVDSLLDGPTWRLLGRAAAELAPVAEWGRQAVRAAAPEAAEQLCAMLAAGGGSDRTEPRRPRVASRDPRYTVFADTRSYRNAPDWVEGRTPYESDLIELLRVNRDEIDAIETFALALFDLVDTAPLNALRHLARLAWDEARHAAIGHLMLAERGADAFGLTCSMIGIDVRAEMDGYDAWAQITLFGELSIIRPMRELARRAAAGGDLRAAAVFEFICADEVLHLRESRRLLDRLHPAGGLEATAEAVRRRAAQLLSAHGVMDEEQYMALSRDEIFALVGE